MFAAKPIAIKIDIKSGETAKIAHLCGQTVIDKTAGGYEEMTEEKTVVFRIRKLGEVPKILHKNMAKNSIALNTEKWKSPCFEWGN